MKVEKLRSFVPDRGIADSLEHLNIPMVDVSEVPCDYDVDESEEIFEEDVVMFCTPNESDVSFLQFHIHNDECTNMFLHHDVYVFSKITDSKCIEIDGNPYVALSTFETEIMIFDPFVRNPMLPQLLLEGHQDSVMSLEYHGGTLFSGGSDSAIIEWDIERRQPRNRVSAVSPVNKIAVFNTSLIYSTSKTLCCLGSKLEFEGDVEKIRIEDDSMLVSDSTGLLKHYDLRNLSETVNERKIHEDSITDIDVFENSIYTSSLDGSINVLDFSTLCTKDMYKTGEKVFSLKVHKNGFCVYGGEENELKMAFGEVISANGID